MANSYLTHSGSTPTLNTKCTLSAWVKRSAIDSDQTFCSIDTDGSNEIYYRFRSDNQLQVYSQITGGQVFNYRTNRLFRDTSAWYHIVTAIDTTQAGGNRMKIYVNGTQETSFQSSTEMNQNSALGFLSGTYAIGRKNNITGNYFDGYLSHVAFVDGQQLAPTVFGETDSTSSIWKFKSPSGVTWGTNGFHLKFENSANLGLDSANSNNFTVNGNLKQALDTPSNNYCTGNPVVSNVTMSKGNLSFSGTYNWKSSLAFDKGKWYAEIKMTNANAYNPMVGIAQVGNTNVDNPGSTNYPGGFPNSVSYERTGNIYQNGGSATQTGKPTFAQNDIMSIAVDLDSSTKTIKWYKNGTLAATENITQTLDEPYVFFTYASGSQAGEGDWNFGNGYFGTTAITSAGSNGNGSLFEYDVPTGYYALNTKNINTYG